VTGLKNLGVIWYGVATHGDAIGPRHMLGYALSMAGFLLYSVSRQRGTQTPGAPAAGGEAKKRA
jgi:hypothetical protein